jgi:cytochrome oxidase Cu insertion factor (SCO1/SenC/PrrC family)
MPHKAPSRRQLLVRMTLALMPWPALAAETVAATGVRAIPTLRGTTFNGDAVALDALRGRVVLVFYWSTGCAVCRDKMRELRANMMGWQGQPFSLIGVNTDPKRQDWVDYDRLVSGTVPASQRFPSVWSGDASYVDSMERVAQLPSACLIDKSGRLVERYRGRIPAEAWDRIAELL